MSIISGMRKGGSVGLITSSSGVRTSSSSGGGWRRSRQRLRRERMYFGAKGPRSGGMIDRLYRRADRGKLRNIIGYSGVDGRGRQEAEGSDSALDG